MTSLKCLVVEECKMHVGFSHLQALINLKTLRLSGWKGTADTEKSIRLPKLKDLDLSYTKNFVGLQWIAMTNLRRLTTSSSDLGDEFCIALSAPGFERLEELDISSGPVTDQGLVEVGKLLSLTYLRISSCSGVTSKGIAHLTALTKLQSLQMAKSAVNSEAAEYLPFLIGLESVDFNKCDVGDAIVPHLANCLKLKNIALSDCPKMTAAAVEELRAIPHVEHVDVASKPWYY